jgi:abequosyltransferase
MPPLLSICIPTFNRKEHLSTSLEALFRELPPSLRSVVEVVVSDNASSDGTEGVLRELHAAHPEIRFRYCRQHENTGATRNIEFLVGEAMGEFIYLLSDDDMVLPGAVASILAIIRENPGIRAICPKATPLVEQPDLVRSEETLIPAEVVADKNEAFVRLGTMLTFLSAVVFRRLAAERFPQEAANSRFSHSFHFVDSIALAGGTAFVQRSCVAVRRNEDVGYDIMEVFVSEFADVLKYARSRGFSRRAVRRVLSEHAGWVAGFIRQFRGRSYSPTVLARVKDSVAVTRVWWHDPYSLLRLGAAIWLAGSKVDGVRRLIGRLRRSSR